MNRDLRERTRGEELWLWRRSLGLTTAEAAGRLGIGRTTYWTCERGDAVPPAGWRALKRPAPALLLGLARRRSGWTLQEVARRAGTSHVTLILREKEGDSGLIAWWERRDFIFM